MHLHQDWALEPRPVTCKTLAQAAVQLGVARLPNLVPNVNTPEVDVPPTEAEFSDLADLALGL
jgi:hypothetical protein